MSPYIFQRRQMGSGGKQLPFMLATLLVVAMGARDQDASKASSIDPSATPTGEMHPVGRQGGNGRDITVKFNITIGGPGNESNGSKLLEAEANAQEEAEAAKTKAEEQARRQAEQEAEASAKEEASLNSEKAAKIKAEEQAKHQAEMEAEAKAMEEARLRDEQEAEEEAEAKLQAEVEAKVREAQEKKEKEDRLKAQEEEAERNKPEEEAPPKAQEEEAEIKTEEEAPDKIAGQAGPMKLKVKLEIDKTLEVAAGSKTTVKGLKQELHELDPDMPMNTEFVLDGKTLADDAAAAPLNGKPIEARAEVPMTPPGPSPAPPPHPSTAPVKAGDKTIPGDFKAVGFVIGQDVTIGAGTTTEEDNNIVAFGSMILENPLKFAHDAGTLVSVKAGPLGPSGHVEPSEKAGDHAEASHMTSGSSPKASDLMPVESEKVETFEVEVDKDTTVHELKEKIKLLDPEIATERFNLYDQGKYLTGKSGPLEKQLLGNEVNVTIKFKEFANYLTHTNDTAGADEGEKLTLMLNDDFCKTHNCPTFDEFGTEEPGIVETLDEVRERDAHRRRGRVWRGMAKRERRVVHNPSYHFHTPYGSGGGHMDTADKIWLQIGWLVWAIVITCVVVFAIRLWTWPWQLPEEASSLDPNEAADPVEASSMNQALWGIGKQGKYLGIAIFLMGMVNFLLFVLYTEIKYQARRSSQEMSAISREMYTPAQFEAIQHANDAAPTAASAAAAAREQAASALLQHDVVSGLHGGCLSDSPRFHTADCTIPILHDLVKFASIFLLAGITLLRLVAANEHPKWRKFQSGGWWRCLISDPYIHFDIAAVALTLSDYIFTVPDMLVVNFLFLCLARTGELLAFRDVDIGMDHLYSTVRKEGKFLFEILLLGVVCWICVGGMYFVSNFNNPLSCWEAAITHPDTKYQHGWQRFQSIPSSMFFALLNLCREHPLATVHSHWSQRLVVMFVNIFGVAVFALPTGLLSTVLNKTMCEKAADDEEKKRLSEASESSQGDQGPEGGEGEYDGSSSSSSYSSYSDDVASSVDGGEAVETGGEAAEAKALKAQKHSDRDWRFYATATLSFGSVFVYFYYTARRTHLHFLVATFDVNITPFMFALVYGLTGLVFIAEWMMRLSRSSDHKTYLLSPLGIVDFLSGFPALAYAAGGPMDCWIWRFSDPHCSSSTFLRTSVAHWLAACCVLRVFKLERFFHSIGDMYDVVKENRAMLKATGFLAVFSVLICAVLLYVSERWNPDPEILENFGSVQRSLWAESINLHGQWVWCDFTALGKGICTFIAFFSVCLCCLPMAVFTNGFYMKLMSSMRVEKRKMASWVQDARLEEPGIRQTVYDMLYWHMHREELGSQPPKYYRLYKTATFLITIGSGIVSCALTLQSSQDESRPSSTGLETASWYLDYFAVMFFVLDFILRTFALGRKHLGSALGVADLVSLVAFSCSLRKSLRVNHLHPVFRQVFVFWDLLIPCRLLRLFSLEHYMGACRMLKRVIWTNKEPFMRSGYALVSMWLVHATLLYNFEKDNWTKQDDTDTMFMADRYADVLTSLQYSMVHLTGDFQITMYTWPSMIVHLFGIVLGMTTLASLTGIFTAAFIDFNSVERAEKLRDAAKKRFCAATTVAIRMQARFRRMRRAREERAKKEEEERGSIELPEVGERHGIAEELLEQGMAITKKSYLHDVVNSNNAFGLYLNVIFDVVLLINIMNTMASTMPEVDADATASSVVFKIEIICDVFFAIQYFLILYVHGLPSCLHFTRIVDAFCLMPALLLIWFQRAKKYDDDSGLAGRTTTLSDQHTWEVMIELMLVFRVVRVLDFRWFRQQSLLLGRAALEAGRNLGVPLVFGLYVWVFSACIFTYTEVYYDGIAQRELSSIPAAMYWTNIFLVGEWSIIDFSIGAGSRLCIFYCVFGIMVFAVPVGVIGEAMQSTLMQVSQERTQLQDLDAIQHRLEKMLLGRGSVAKAEEETSRAPRLAAKSEADWLPIATPEETAAAAPETGKGLRPAAKSEADWLPIASPEAAAAAATSASPQDEAVDL